MKKILLLLLLFSINAKSGQELKLTLGAGTPLVIDGVFGTDIGDSKNVLWNSHDHVIGLLIVTLPLNIVAFSL